MIVLLLLLSIPVIICLLCYMTIEIYAYRRVYKNILDVPTCVYAMVLGTNPKRRDGQPNRYFVYRMDAAQELFASHKAEFFILSGDKHDEYDEPAEMATELIKRGVLSDRLILDGKGYDTVDSILFAKRQINEEPLIIVSQDFHTERAVFLAGCLGVDAVAYEAKDIDNLKVTKTDLREVLARVKAFYDVICIKLKIR